MRPLSLSLSPRIKSSFSSLLPRGVERALAFVLPSPQLFSLKNNFVQCVIFIHFGASSSSRVHLQALWSFQILLALKPNGRIRIS